MNRFLLFALGALGFFIYGCSEKEQEPVDIDRMVQAQEEELPEWTAPLSETLITGEPQPQEMIVPEGSELLPE